MITLRNIGVLAVILVLMSVFFVSQVSFGQGLTGGKSASDCTASSTTYTIGNEESTEVLPAYGLRAWATVQQPFNATNTASVAFGEDAVSGQGYGLNLDNNSTGASTTDSVRFGLNTDLPYTGAVEVITSTGSTTANVIECRY